MLIDFDDRMSYPALPYNFERTGQIFQKIAASKRSIFHVLGSSIKLYAAFPLWHHPKIQNQNSQPVQKGVRLKRKCTIYSGLILVNISIYLFLTT